MKIYRYYKTSLTTLKKPQTSKATNSQEYRIFTYETYSLSRFKKYYSKQNSTFFRILQKELLSHS